MSLAPAVACGSDEFLRDVLEGLARNPKALPGKYLWDEEGSSIFDAICKSEGYYVAALETALLHDCAGEVAQIVGGGACIVEFGSGVSRKVRILLGAMESPRRYIAIDISRAFMEAAAARLRDDYPALDVFSVCADYTRPLPALPLGRARAVLGFFPGAALGNIAPGDAVRLLRRMAKALGPGWLLVAQDHTCDAAALKAAYGGPLMAAFHKNVLSRMRRELRTRIAPDDFEHEARVAAGPVRVEAHLVAKRPTVVEAGVSAIRLAAGESIRTDASWKHSTAEFEAMIRKAGLIPVRSWMRSGCALYLLAPAPKQGRSP
jgi:dimethylhistidine N-methyltransferase